MVWLYLSNLSFCALTWFGAHITAPWSVWYHKTRPACRFSHSKVLFHSLFSSVNFTCDFHILPCHILFLYLHCLVCQQSFAQLCCRRNIDTSGIFEKEQLVELLSNCRLSEETANIMNASQGERYQFHCFASLPENPFVFYYFIVFFVFCFMTKGYTIEWTFMSDQNSFVC